MSKQARSKPSLKPSPTQPDGGRDAPSDAPRDVEEMRSALARKLARFVGNQEGVWRNCPHACCRRARGCVAPSGDCINLPPPRETTPEEDARIMAELQRMLRERLEQDGDGSEEAGK
jgi:hypothetical protein